MKQPSAVFIAHADKLQNISARELMRIYISIVVIFLTLFTLGQELSRLSMKIL